MAGLGGAFLSLSYTPMWVEEMTAGPRLDRAGAGGVRSWRPWRAAARRLSVRRRHHPAALRPGRGRFGVPAQVMSMLPYLATIVVLAIISGRTVDGPARTRRPASASRSVPPPDRIDTPQGEDPHDSSVCRAAGFARRQRRRRPRCCRGRAGCSRRSRSRSASSMSARSATMAGPTATTRPQGDRDGTSATR